MKERLHTADHILFTILERKFPIISLAMEFGENSCRVDYKCENDLRDLKEEIESEVNKIINENLNIISYNLEREKAKEVVDLSLVPGSIKNIKVYEIIGFNKIACAGPHVNNTKDIGKFKIISIKKKQKGCYSIRYSVEN